MSKRIKTNYPGVYYREATRIGHKGTEKVYYIVFKKDGKTIEEKVGRQFADNMTPAKAAGRRSDRIEGKRKSRREIREEQEAARKAEAGKWTIKRLWDAYKAQRTQNKGLAVDANRFTNYLETPFGNKAPDEIITLDVDRVRIRLLKKKSPQTVKHVMALLKRSINFGVKKGLCPMPDPTKLQIELPRVDNKKTEDLTPDQLKDLMTAIEADSNRQIANLMKLALYTGMRRGELFNLKWQDLNFEKEFIHIRAPKGGQSQDIPMNDLAKTILESHERTDSEYVFPGQNGNRRTDTSIQTRKIKEKAGLPADFRALHGLRHVYASTLASSGKVDMYTLQKLLTHKSPQMTQRYAHLRDEALQRASGVAEDIFKDIGKEEQGKEKVVNLDDHRR